MFLSLGKNVVKLEPSILFELSLSLSFASHPQLSGQIVEIVLLQHVAATTEATVETGCPLHSAARTKTTRMANYYRMQL